MTPLVEGSKCRLRLRGGALAAWPGVLFPKRRGLTNGGELIEATGPLESRPTMLPACCGACSSYITLAALLHEACRRRFAPS